MLLAVLAFASVEAGRERRQLVGALVNGILAGSGYGYGGKSITS